MQDFYEILRELVEWTAGPDALVLSVYLDVARERAAASVARASAELSALAEHHADEGGARHAAFAELARQTAGALADLASEARARDYDGLALFACAEPALRRVLHLRFPFRNQVEVGRDPFLRQLLYYAEEYERAVCAAVDGDAIAVCEVQVGDVGRTRPVVPSHGRTPAEELAALLGRLVHDDPRLHVILLGRPDDLRRIEPALGATVLGRVIDRIDAPLRPGDPAFLPAVHRSLQAYERASEAAGVRQMLEGRASGVVALGVRETLEAINHARIRTLYVLQSFSGRAWLCDACDRLGALPAPPACTGCGASVSTVPLEEHLLDQAAACGAEVETVMESSELAEVGGVGALLHGM